MWACVVDHECGCTVQCSILRGQSFAFGPLMRFEASSGVALRQHASAGEVSRRSSWRFQSNKGIAASVSFVQKRCCSPMHHSAVAESTVLAFSFRRNVVLTKDTSIHGRLAQRL